MEDTAAGRTLEFEAPIVIGEVGDGYSDHVIDLLMRKRAFTDAAVLFSGRTEENSLLVPGLPANAKLLIVARTDAGQWSSEMIETGAPGSTIDVVMDFVQQDREVLEIVDRHSLPVVGAVVHLLSHGEVGRAITDEKGQIAVHGLAPANRYRVRIEAGHLVNEIAVPGQNEDSVRRIVLAEPTLERMRCRVVDSRGAPVAGIPVSFCMAGGATTAAMSDHDGVASAMLPQGARVMAVAYAQGVRAPVWKVIVDGEAVLALPDPVQTVIFHLAPVREPGLRTQIEIVDDKGAVVKKLEVRAFERAQITMSLKAGDYVARVRSEGRETESRFTVSGDEQTDVPIELG
jgi:hypothetical protein